MEPCGFIKNVPGIGKKAQHLEHWLLFQGSLDLFPGLMSSGGSQLSIVAPGRSDTSASTGTYTHTCSHMDTHEYTKLKIKNKS